MTTVDKKFVRSFILVRQIEKYTMLATLHFKFRSMYLAFKQALLAVITSVAARS